VEKRETDFADKRVKRAKKIVESKRLEADYYKLLDTFSVDSPEDIVDAFTNGRSRNTILSLEVSDLSSLKGGKEETLRKLSSHL
jgi:hypothetical protein